MGMTWGQTKTFARNIIPEAKEGKIDSDILELILKMGITDIFSKTEINKKSVYFNAEANISSYDIKNKICSDFLEIDESGIWFNQGDSDDTQYEPLKPYTEERMDKQFRNWRDDDSGTPERYFIKNNIVEIHPAPNDALTDGFLFNYISKEPDLSSNSYYPFSGQTEQPQYFILDNTLMMWWRWYAYGILKRHELSLKWADKYEIDVQAKKKQLSKRKDIFKSKRTRLRGPYIR
jgi:hypothetical protein